MSCYTKLKLFLGSLAICCLIAGCQSTQANIKKSQENSSEDVAGALVTMTEVMTDKELSEKDIENLGRQLGKNKEAQSAVQSINQALSGEIVVKYCPVTGKRYAAHLQICPIHNQDLVVLED